MVAVQRLAHDRIADPVGEPDRVVDRAHRLRPRHRQAGRGQQRMVRSLSLAMSTAIEDGLRRHRGPDPLRVHALAELDQASLVQPDPRDVAGDRLVDDRLGRRAERGPLGLVDELLQLGGRSRSPGRLDQVVDEPDGELAGGQADRLVGVRVDDVVAAGHALDLAGLAAAHVVAGLLLELQRDVLGDVAQPGALVQPLDETAAAAAASSGAVSRGRCSSSRSVKPGIVLDGKFSSEPRSTTRWMAGS